MSAKKSPPETGEGSSDARPQPSVPRASVAGKTKAEIEVEELRRELARSKKELAQSKDELASSKAKVML